MDAQGNDERDFLAEAFSSPGKLLDAIFLKGYQWPFDPRKMENEGSSLIDLLVYREEVIRGRRVMLDFSRNPNQLLKEDEVDFTRLGEEAYTYLKNSDALLGTPYDRLRRMNPAAIEVYRDHGIDLACDRLEISVCAQHNNGGVAANSWWESDIRHLFPVGEVNGSHGVYRPGGTALNSGQVGSMRAADYITHRYKDEPPRAENFLVQHDSDIQTLQQLAEACLLPSDHTIDVPEEIARLRDRMTRYGAFIRSREGARQAIQGNRAQWEAVREPHLKEEAELPAYFRLLDLLTAQYVYLSAIADFIDHQAVSRGSYLVYDAGGRLPQPSLEECFRCTPGAGDIDHIQEITYDPETEKCQPVWRMVRPIPDDGQWFETVWRDWRKGKIYE